MYDPKSIESKWQKQWQNAKVFKTQNPVTEADFKIPKYYTLDMFPYPSGAGLHVGHPKGYIATDIVSRYKHAKGYRVLHPMGWDSFGLPAENYAIKTGVHPKITTDNNIANYKRQLLSLGFSYDWDREIATTDPLYYKWTQWIFLKLFEAGLAYEQDLPINYCPSCKTGLANEEVLADRTCDRCGTTVERRKLRQWVLAITKYAERLLGDVDKLDWPEGIKEMQRNWIGKSEGVEFDLAKADDMNTKLSVYTTRIDTVYGMTYVVIAPDHPEVDTWITNEQRKACEKYITEAKSKSDQDRTNEGKEKTGVFTGSYVTNPFNNKQVPVWIADYVLGSYGTGAVMAVPAHDERDFEFAKKYDLEIIESIAPYLKDNPRSDRETEKRDVIVGIVRNPKDNTYLCLDWKTTEWKSFPSGGLDGDDLVTGAKRELEEETGYKNMTFVRQIGSSIFAEFYRPHKDSNVFSNFQYLLFNLDDEEQSPVAEKERAQHEALWVAEDKVDSFLNVWNQKLTWKRYREGDFAHTEDGILVHSAEFTGLKSEEARERMAEWVEKNGVGKKKVNYKLRDWLFSRQRYWGEPIPLVHIDIENLKQLPHITSLGEATDPKMAYILKREPIQGENCVGAMCGDKARVLVIGGKEFSKVYDGIYSKIVCDYRLPLELPEVERYEPSGDGDSPLALVPNFVNVELASNLVGRRETNTMPQWAGSCWYYLRFMDPDNTETLIDPKIAEYWGEVDNYVGGAEHAVLHLLYARFWHKFLFDIGVVPNDEPFKQLHNPGMILAYAYERENGGLVAVDLIEERDGKFYEKTTDKEVKKIVAKMSKSLKNVVNPDAVTEEHGVDTFRLYEMSMADFKDTAPWNTDAIIGVRRFLERIWKNFAEEPKMADDDMKAMKLLHKTIKKVGEDIDIYKFNTAISALMILINGGLPRDMKLQKEWKEDYLKLLHPFAPHIAEELWSLLGHTDSIYMASWPKYDENMIQDDEVTIAVQVNGKLRGTFVFSADTSEEEVSKNILQNPDITKWIEGKEIIKKIFVPNKLFSIVVK